MRRLLAISFFILCVSCKTAHQVPPRAIECNELCVRYINENDLYKAEIQCDLGLSFDEDYWDLWVNKGLIAMRRNQNDKAKEYFIKALRLNQDSAQAYNNLGNIYLTAREFGKAYDNFQRALKINPDYLEARFNLGLVLRELKQPEKARREFKTILELHPNLADPYAQLAQLALDDGATEEAIDNFAKATQLDPNYVAAWLGMGNAYMEAGKPCDAKDAYTSCMEVDANDAQCRNNIVIAQKKCQLQDKALQDLKDRQSGQKTPETEFAAALQFKERGMVNDEERAYKRCIKYDGKYVLCHYGLFEIFKGRNDERNAIVACKNFLKFSTEAEYPSQTLTCQQYVKE